MRPFIALLMLLALPVVAHAACTNPTAEAGTIVFSDAAKAMQYCNGTDWINTGAVIANAPQTGCTGPTAKAGAVLYNGTLGVVQFCNGSSWIDTACARDRKPNGPGCSGKPAGTLQYVGSPVNELQFCDSTDWVAMGWPCGSMGLVDWSLAQQIQKITASDGTGGDRFGWSVSLWGDTALVGSYLDDDSGTDSGSAYIFTRNGGAWAQQAKLTASDGAANDWFGWSVSLWGDTALVGASTKTNQQGAAYVFTLNGGAWTQQAKLTASDGTANDYFGASVSLFGDTALVGSYMKDGVAGSYQGAAYVFIRNGTSWTQQAKITSSDADVSDRFGLAVALSNNTALIGAYNKTGSGGTGQGAAYVFTRTGNTWTQQAKLIAADGAAGDNFGLSVSLSGDTALIGAYYDDDRGSNSGSVYVFNRTGTSWTQQAKITAADGGIDDQFGERIALLGDTALVGATRDDDRGNNSGSVYVFTRSGTTWNQRTKIIAADGAADDQLASSVAITSNTALVGAPLDDDRGNASGSAYFFSPSP